MNNAANKTSPHNADLDSATQFVSCFNLKGEYCEIEHKDLVAAMDMRRSLVSSVSPTDVRTWSVRKSDFID
jgi:hypothetical protein